MANKPRAILFFLLLAVAFSLLSVAYLPRSADLTTIGITDPNEEIVNKSNVRMLFKEGWTFEIWTRGRVTQPSTGIALRIRLTREPKELSIAPVATAYASLIKTSNRMSVRKTQVIVDFRDPSTNGFRSRKEWNLDNDAEEPLSFTFPVFGTWEATILDLFHSNVIEDPTATPIKSGKYMIGLKLQLENGVFFEPELLTMDVVGYRLHSPVD